MISILLQSALLYKGTLKNASNVNSIHSAMHACTNYPPLHLQVAFIASYTPLTIANSLGL